MYLLGLGNFAQRDVFEGGPCHCLHQKFVPRYSCAVSIA